MDPAFPFLISLGINNLFQGFRDKEFGFVGIIHLWWGWKNNHFLYDKHIKSSILHSGFWHSKWFNSQEDQIKLSKKIPVKAIDIFIKILKKVLTLVCIYKLPL